MGFRFEGFEGFEGFIRVQNMKKGFWFYLVAGSSRVSWGFGGCFWGMGGGNLETSGMQNHLKKNKYIYNKP